MLRTWWTQEVVYLVDKLRLTRRELVLSAADKDGGAHVDATLEPTYECVLEGAEWKMTLYPNDGAPKELRPKYGHLAALRQIGYEALHSDDLLRCVR